MTSSAKFGIAALAVAAAAVCQAQQIQVQVDGQPVYFANAQPQYINGRVLVPLRGVFEQMGASVNWNPQTRMVSAMRGSSDVELRIGDRMAMINGNNTALDVPAMIVNGSTMVPIRFVSEALGAQVGWMEANHLVSINTGAIGNDINTGYNNGNYNSGTIRTPARPLRRVMVRRDEVIPVVLDHTLSTVDNRRGDTFTATVRTDGDTYGDIPNGTKIEGHVAAVHGHRNNQPAILDLSFDRMRFPNGRSVKIDGTLTNLNDQYVERNSNGVLVMRNGANRNGTDQRMVYAGYGAGAGLLVGVLGKKPLEGAILGGALGYILGQVKHDQNANTRPTDSITLQPGTEMGVRVNQDVAVSW